MPFAVNVVTGSIVTEPEPVKPVVAGAVLWVNTTPPAVPVPVAPV